MSRTARTSWAALVLGLWAPFAAGAAEPAQDDFLAEPAGAEKAAPGASRGATFGAELGFLKLETSISGYGDLIFAWVPGRSATFDASHFNPIIGARIGEWVNAELELEIEGSGVRAEYGFFDFSQSQRLLVRAGKFLVPIGQFNEVLHPSFRWDMVSRPLVFTEVLPAVWSNTGLQVRGTLPFAAGTSVDYAACVLNGLGHRGAPADSEQVLRDSRENLIDNNLDKAVGGRVGLTFLGGEAYGATTVGFSAYTGALDDAAISRLTILDVDVAVHLGPLSLSAEAVQTYLGPEARALTPFESGFYVKASGAIGPVDVSGRFDYALTRPFLEGVRADREAVLAVKYAFSPMWSLRAEVTVPLAAVPGPPRLAAMLAFSF